MWTRERGLLNNEDRGGKLTNGLSKAPVSSKDSRVQGTESLCRSAPMSEKRHRVQIKGQPEPGWGVQASSTLSSLWDSSRLQKLYNGGSITLLKTFDMLD